MIVGGLFQNEGYVNKEMIHNLLSRVVDCILDTYREKGYVLRVRIIERYGIQDNNQGLKTTLDEG